MTAPWIADLEAEAATVIVLPWPDRRLSPNARLHWRAKAPLTKEARSDAFLATVAAIGGTTALMDARDRFKGCGPVPIGVTFFPPDRRRRDTDNAIASMKHAFDGIADALAIDDNRFRPSFDFGEPSRPARVEVTL